jgi:hypothetical protein
MRFAFFAFLVFWESDLSAVVYRGPASEIAFGGRAICPHHALPQ